MKRIRSKMPTLRRISVIGDGSWGSTLAVYLARKGYAVTLWGAFPDYVHRVKRTRVSPKFLPGIKIPRQVKITADLSEALDDAELLVLAVPSQYIAGVLKKIRKQCISRKIFLSVVKGIDTESLQRISQMIRRELGPVKLAVLSGPTIAREVASGIPTTAVIASRDSRISRQLQQVFNSKSFRIYTNRDIVGLELGGSLKNVIAIACGVCDGLGFGTNTKAAILTRGLAEMARLGQAMGASRRTFCGLAGLGDLVTTATSPQSRNRHVGEELGRGKSIKKILKSMDMVAEGVATAKAVYRLSKKHRVSMPIATEVYNILYRRKRPLAAVADLMGRKMRPE